jgi:hypothetical protein
MDGRRADDDGGGGVLDAAYRPGPATNQEIPTMRQRFATLAAAALMLALLVPVASVSAASAIHVHHGQSIQNAIDSAPAGGRIYVAPGTYQGNLEITRSVHLIGDHAVIVPAESPRDNPCLAFLHGVGVPGICAHGTFNLDGSIQAPISNVSIEGFTVRNFSGPGIVAAGVDGFRAAHDVTAHNGFWGMAANVSKDVSLLDNTSYDNGSDGLHVDFAPYANAVITGNTSYRNLGYGIFFLDALGGRIASNDVHDNCAGIGVAAALGDPSGNVSVQHNQVTSNNRLCPEVPNQAPEYGGIGVALIGVQNTTVKHNVVRNNRTQAAFPGGGIVLLNGDIFGAAAPTGNSIRQNRLSGNTPFDIYGDGSGASNTVSGNSCHTTNLTGAC